MKRKRKVNYPPPRNQKRAAPAGGAGPFAPPSVAAIDVTAGLGRTDVGVGSRVTILGGGLYAGELATVERLVGGVIPAALVRTEAGLTRQVRTIDLEPAGRRSVEPAAG